METVLSESAPLRLRRRAMGRKRKGPRDGVSAGSVEFCGRLNELMSARGITPKVLAGRLGLAERTVYDYLRGACLPRVDDLPKLVRALELETVRELLPKNW